MLNLNYEPDVLVEDITTLSHDEWKLYRTLGIGGSDAAAVCGISPWKTARDYLILIFSLSLMKRSICWSAKPRSVTTT